MNLDKLEIKENHHRDMKLRRWSFKNVYTKCGAKGCTMGCLEGKPSHGPYSSLIRRRFKERPTKFWNQFEEVRIGRFMMTPAMMEIINTSEEVVKTRKKGEFGDVRYQVYKALREYGYPPADLVALIYPKKLNWEERYQVERSTRNA